MANTRDYGKTSGPRRRFAAGGSVYPVPGASGSARWQGAGPEHYAEMRSEMSPSDFATFKSVATPEQYNTFMGISSPTPAVTMPAMPSRNLSLPNRTPPAAAPRPEFKPQALTQTVAKAPPVPQAQEVKPYVKSGPVV